MNPFNECPLAFFLFCLSSQWHSSENPLLRNDVTWHLPLGKRKKKTLHPSGFLLGFPYEFTDIPYIQSEGVTSDLEIGNSVFERTQDARCSMVGFEIQAGIPLPLHTEGSRSSQPGGSELNSTSFRE